MKKYKISLRYRITLGLDGFSQDTGAREEFKEIKMLM